jgi:hypothetical protein
MADKCQSGIKAGSTSISLCVTLQSSIDGSAVTGKVHTDVTYASYWRQGGTVTTITPATLAAINSAYSSGGFKEADSTNAPGVYRFDIPDAAAATGADWVVIALVISGCLPITYWYPLTTNTVNSGDPYGVVTDATYGNSALHTDIADIHTDVGDIHTDVGGVPAAVMASTIEGTLTVTQSLRLLLSALAGKLSGGGTTTLTFRDTADSKNRIVATVDSSGNRSGITTDVS